eukprot:NODE_1830_length_743_cov_56.881844_g1424_i0.p1 GENE.NODE_1830_length_743_cov_56.881844_g1424_i0~~NODE_1830_length_743_cov_56.881844_g1424_i0.p1  ORF type:complete len:157 (-),score=47.06 NODE_1830_length_743_cov_56.881844_g1424_i0:170-640(-)
MPKKKSAPPPPPPPPPGPVCHINATVITTDVEKYASPIGYKGLQELPFQRIGTFYLELWRAPDEFRVMTKSLMAAVMKLVPATKKIGFVSPCPRLRLTAVVDPKDPKRKNWDSIHEAQFVEGEGEEEEGQWVVTLAIQKDPSWRPPKREEEELPDD